MNEAGERRDIGEMLREYSEKLKREYVMPDLNALLEQGAPPTLDSGEDLSHTPQTQMKAPLGRLKRYPNGAVTDVVFMTRRGMLNEVSWADPVTNEGMVRFSWLRGTTSVDELRAPTEEEMKTTPFCLRGEFETGGEYDKKTQHNVPWPK